ncbi:MAG: hypothetical protein R2788_11995 [Saprospiraceae bacterium]
MKLEQNSKISTFSLPSPTIFLGCAAMIAQSVSGRRFQMEREIANAGRRIIQLLSIMATRKTSIHCRRFRVLSAAKGGLSGYQSNIEAIGRLSTGGENPWQAWLKV